MSDPCENCPEVRKLSFQIEGLELVTQKQRVLIDGIKQEQMNRDIEQEASIQSISNRMESFIETISARMDMSSADYTDLRDDVKSSIKDMKDNIPKLFTDTVNAMLAKIAKWLMIGICILIGIVGLALTRPIILSALEEITNKVETMEVPK